MDDQEDRRANRPPHWACLSFVNGVAEAFDELGLDIFSSLFFFLHLQELNPDPPTY